MGVAEPYCNHYNLMTISSVILCRQITGQNESYYSVHAITCTLTRDSSSQQDRVSCEIKIVITCMFVRSERAKCSWYLLQNMIFFVPRYLKQCYMIMRRCHSFAGQYNTELPRYHNENAGEQTPPQHQSTIPCTPHATIS